MIVQVTIKTGDLGEDELEYELPLILQGLASQIPRIIQRGIRKIDLFDSTDCPIGTVTITSESE